MIVLLGLVILVVAAIAGVDAVLGNGGHGHALTSGFSMLGYHVTGSTGTLFLYGIVVGAVAMLGLSLLLGGARHTSRRGSAARHGLSQSRRETAAVSQDRDDLIRQRDKARADTDSTPGDGTPASSPASPDGDRGGWRHLFERRPAAQQPAASHPASATPQAATQPDQLAAQPVPDVPTAEPARSAANGSRP
jgi:hypothetical protein